MNQSFSFFDADAPRAERHENFAVCDLPSFGQFDQWMDDELAELVKRWEHAAAPNAKRPERHRDRFSM